MIGKASEIKCLVVNEMQVNGGIECFQTTLNRAIESLGDSEVISVEYKQNHSFCDDGSNIFYDTALIIYKQA